MNEEFLTRHRKSPRPEFAAALYQRISRPMQTQTQIKTAPRRVAQMLAVLTAVLAITFAFSPGARALAGGLFHQIGAFFFYTGETPMEPGPTAAPFAGKVQQAADAAEAGKLAGFAVLPVGYLPEGYKLDGPWAVVEEGQSTAAASYFTDAAGHFLHIGQNKYGPNDRYELFYKEGQPVTVRGQAGMWITGELFKNDAGEMLETSWLVWAEDGVNYTLYADNLSYEEMVKVAEGLGK